MGSFNRATILGRLGADPELRQVGESRVCNLSVATDESWKDKAGTKHEKTEWHKIQAWSGLADLCEKYLKKGREVLIEGRLQTRSWDDKDGKKRYSTEIMADRVVFVGSGQERDPHHDQRPAQDHDSGSQVRPDDDIPF